MTRLHRWWLPALFASALVVAACGGDDDDNKTSDGGTDGGKDGGNIDSGTKDAAADAATGVACGTNVCADPFPLPGVPKAVVCCYQNSVCSALNVSGQCAAPAVLDTECGDLNIPELPTFGIKAQTVKGCCTATSSGQCGIDSTTYGQGCRATADIKQLFGVIPGVTLPQEKACNVPDAGTLQVRLNGMDAGF